MAGRTLNRHELRRQADQAEKPETVVAGAAAAAAQSKKGAKRKAAATPKPKKPRKQKAPRRMRARWGVFDGSMKQVAIFDYAQRADAEEKLADLLAKKKNIHFLKVVKEPIPDSELVEAPVVG